MTGYIEFTSHGDWSATETYLKNAANRVKMEAVLHKFGQVGVNALRSATPAQTGVTANSWYYEVTSGEGGMSIVWRNNHMAGSTSVAILLQYGHGTGTGGYVQGYDFINPVIQPIFDTIASEVFKVVTTG